MVMLNLYGDRAVTGTGGHFRSVCVALLMWQHWHEGLYGCMFTEELSEAFLSRFASRLRKSTWAVDVHAMEDVFLQVQPGHMGVHDIRHEGPTQQLRQKVQANLRAFINAQGVVVTTVLHVLESVVFAVHGPLG